VKELGMSPPASWSMWNYWPTTFPIQIKYLEDYATFIRKLIVSFLMELMSEALPLFLRNVQNNE
jgi:hypothetical protein